MISSTFGGYMIARLGMQASQSGLHITGQNLTNAGTDGYTRQRIDQISINYSGTYRYASKYNVNIGNGVLVTGTSQLRDPFLDLRYRNEVAHATEQSTKLDVLNDLKDILDEVKNAGEDSLGDGGIFNQLGDIYTKLQQLSNQVGNKEFETMVKGSCQSLITLFNSYSTRIDEVKTNLEYDMENVNIPQVNKILENIQNINKAIKNSEIVGDSALELKDERNRQIDALSQYMKIKVTYKPIAVSDSRVVDECHISMVGSDGKNYEIISDDQRREFILSKEGDKWNVALGKLSPIDGDLKAAYESALRGVARAEEIYNNSTSNFETARDNFKQVSDEHNKLIAEAEKLRELATGDGNTNGGLYETWQKAVEKYNEAFIKKDPPTPADELKALREARDEAKNKYNDAERAARQAEAAVTKNQSTYDKSQKAYEEAKEFLDVNPNPPVKDLDGTTDAHGGGKAAENVAAAEVARDKALAALEQSELDAQPVDSVNTTLMDGILKGALDMLNYSAEYDNPPNSIRGIGYYKNMLDSLANKFATEMNAANNRGIDVGGTDADGNIIPAHDLFKSADGGKITAGNINIADGWLDNSYGITVAYKEDPDDIASGTNNNVDHFVSLFGNKLQYKADINLMNAININNSSSPNKSQIEGVIGADGKKVGGGMKNGDTITIDGKTYTFAEGATGESGNEFSDLASLQKAAAKNGIDIKEGANGELTATTTAQDLKGLVTVNGKTVNLADINVDSMHYGDTVTIDGETFTYRQTADTTADETDFNDMDSLIAAAAAKNITITADNTTGKITDITKAAGVDMTDDLKDNLNSSPSINGMAVGDTIEIDGKTFTMCQPPAPGTQYSDQKLQELREQGKFYDMDTLKAAAKEQGLTLYGNADTGEITSVTKPGSNLFNGTFEESFTNIGNTLAIDVSTTSEKLDNYSQLAGSISEEREAVTGVSLDEEAMNIRRYQQAYTASARLMTALDEMLNVLLTQTGLVGR